MERVARKVLEKVLSPAQALLGQLPESGEINVALKMPNGMRLRIYRFEEAAEDVMGGGKRIYQRAVQLEDEVLLHGNTVEFGKIPEYKIIGGFAITEGVDAEFFRVWVEQNAQSELVKRGLIYAYESAADVSARAKEFKSLKSGLEPEDPSNPRLRAVKSFDKADMAA